MQIIRGQTRVGGQEHFYLEPHACIVTPGERGVMHIECTTQSVSQIQVAILVLFIFIYFC